MDALVFGLLAGAATFVVINTWLDSRGGRPVSALATAAGFYLSFVLAES